MKANTATSADRLAAATRILVRGGPGSSTTRFVALSALCVIAAVSGLLNEQHHGDWATTARTCWQVALLGCAALVTRGVLLGRPVTLRHALWAGSVLCCGIALHILGFGSLGNVVLILSGIVLMAPTAAAPEVDAPLKVWPLVNATVGDPLAPFAMQPRKCHHFNVDGSAAIAYHVAGGYAVVSGDPIGAESAYGALVSDFVAMCRNRGWRIVVLACRRSRAGLWTSTLGGRALLTVPIGHDVVIDVNRFHLTGRRFRNLRQAVQRTHNRGVTTTVVDEQNLDPALTAELTAVVYASHHAARTQRGFSMNLDGALEGRYPGIKLIVARDRSGVVQGFHRYATAGHGQDVSLDAPYRRPDAPNGIDERLSVDMIAESKRIGAESISLAFAPFPKIFDNGSETWHKRLQYRLAHLLDHFIRVECLYRYLRKFHAFGEERCVVVRAQDVPAALLVLLWLEFQPRPRHLQVPSSQMNSATRHRRNHSRVRPGSPAVGRSPATRQKPRAPMVMRAVTRRSVGYRLPPGPGGRPRPVTPVGRPDPAR